jgi:hypothetical protein
MRVSEGANASATVMGRRGEINIGELVRTACGE